MLEVDSFRIPKPLSNKARLVPGILTDFRVISASLTTKIALFERYGQSKRAVGGTGMLTCADFPASGRTSFSAAARRKSDHAPLLLAPAALATWRSRQDVGEHLPSAGQVSQENKGPVSVGGRAAAQLSERPESAPCCR